VVVKECSSAALALIAALACQTDRPERRDTAEPTEPHKAVEPVAPGTASAARPGEPAAPAPAPLVPLTRPKEPLNVLLLSVEAWRADMPWTGYGRAIAPRLTQLAAESSVWENHRAVSSHTPQALAALLSSRYVSSLYRDGAALTRFTADDTFLPEVLQAKGVRTIGVQANTYFDKASGFEQGFDVWEVVPGAGTGFTADAQVTSEQQASRLIELLGQAQNTDRQFFAWAHFLDPNDPYVSHADVPDFGKQPRDRYDAEVYFTDLWLGKVLEFARRQSWWGRTAVIITGDHGVALGEHGLSQHGSELWDVLLQTPLLIHAPGAKPVRIQPARSQIDLAPTVVELMGLPRVPEFRGQSLLPELYGAPAAARPVLLFELCEDSENPGLRALLAGDDKLIVPSAGGPERLFNLKSDPPELEDLGEAQPKKLRELAVRFEREWARIPSIEPHGGMKLRSGRLAQGPERRSR
jgi:arylsulfatase A-like enzyme